MDAKNAKLILDAISADKSLLTKVLNACIKHQKYEPSHQLRDLRDQLYPPTEEQAEAREKMKKLDLFFRLLDITMFTPKDQWILWKVITLFNEHDQDIDLKTVSAIPNKARELFD